MYACMYVCISVRLVFTTYPKREHSFFYGKEICMGSIGKKVADVVFASYQYLYFNSLQLESMIALLLSHLFQINTSSDVDVFRQTGNVK